MRNHQLHQRLFRMDRRAFDVGVASCPTYFAMSREKSMGGHIAQTKRNTSMKGSDPPVGKDDHNGDAVRQVLPAAAEDRLTSDDLLDPVADR
jgi:hypothetical protein